MRLLIARVRHPWWSRALLPACAWIGVVVGRLAMVGRDAELGYGDLPEAAALGLVIAGIVFVCAFARRGLGWWIGALLTLHALFMRDGFDLAGSLIFGALSLIGSSVLLSPVLALSWTALRSPVDRCVTHECLIAALYGVCVIGVTQGTLRDEALPIAGLADAATVAVGALGLAWDLVARAQIRAVMGGRVAGWRVGDGAAAELPRLWWLNAFDTRRSRVLYRVEFDATVYRGASNDDAAIARLPTSIPPIGFAALLCGGLAMLVAAQWRGGR